MKYAYFLNESNVVVNTIVCEDNVDDAFLNSVLELDAFSSASSYVVVEEETRKLYVGIGASYDGIRFTPKRPEEGDSEWSFSEEKWVNKPFTSWSWDSALEAWKAPVEKPEGEHEWNEETQSWEEKEIFIPYPDFDEALANGLAKRINV